MLAVQLVRVYWTKDDRSPEGAQLRKGCYAPALIPESVSTDGTHPDGDVFLQRRYYRQDGEIYTEHEWNRQFYRRTASHTDPREIQITGQRAAEKLRRDLLAVNTREHEYEGIFLPLPELDVRGIEIERHGDTYDVIWHSLEGNYVPVRRGFNTEYPRFANKNLKCEKAFSLAPGEAGKLQYNYRCMHGITSRRGWHYEQYCVYAVNAPIARDMFIREYEKSYDEMVHLF